MSEPNDPPVQRPTGAGPSGAATPGEVGVLPAAVARMDAEIARLTRQGYVIVSRMETSAQLKRAKHFSIWWALFWLVVAPGAGLLVYLAWYILIKRDRVVFLRITPDGRVLSSES
jgi:hypothetical protein